MRNRAPQLLLMSLICLCTEQVGEAHIVVHFTAGCSVVEQTSDAPIDVRTAASAVAKELGFEPIRGGYKNSRNGRIIFVETGHDPGDYFITSYTNTEAEIPDGKRDAVVFARRLLKQFPKGVLIQPTKICGPGPDF
jgi:hypothetical protein